MTPIPFPMPGTLGDEEHCAVCGHTPDLWSFDTSVYLCQSCYLQLDATSECDACNGVPADEQGSWCGRHFEEMCFA
jgi:hypothetical protein